MNIYGKCKPIDFFIIRTMKIEIKFSKNQRWRYHTVSDGDIEINRKGVSVILPVKEFIRLFEVVE